MEPSRNDIDTFQSLIEEFRYDYAKLVYIIFPFGEKGSELEFMAPYDWQMEELRRMSIHMMNPLTRFDAYRLIISSGNGAAKTAFGAMVVIMLLYTQRLRARMTANTEPQLRTVVWPEYDRWFRLARFNEVFFEKYGTSIKAKNKDLEDTWRLDTVTWSENSPASISGLHNKGRAIAYIFEEAPGIPANIWKYASGAFTETETIKIWLAFGNSDDPESKFEQNMQSRMWHSRRIDTRELKHIDKKQIADWLEECGGNEDHDDFRVRVRGLPRKSARDSIIGYEVVKAAIERAEDFDLDSIARMPVVLTCDPAWTGGDETTIWYTQGNYSCLLERYKLNKAEGQDHTFTYNRLCHWERQLGADAVFIDQGEGTAIYTLANNQGKFWELVSFAGSANDAADFRDSEYGNIRAQMYYNANQWLMRGGIIDSKDKDWLEDIIHQLSWTKGSRHKVHGKKMAEPKLDIKKRVGKSPDIADGFVLNFYRAVVDRLPENVSGGGFGGSTIGGEAFKMPEHPDPYATMDVDYVDLYR